MLLVMSLPVGTALIMIFWPLRPIIRQHVCLADISNVIYLSLILALRVCVFHISHDHDPPTWAGFVNELTTNIFI